MTEEAPYSVFKTVLYYSLIILTAPILTFFSSKFVIFEGVFGINSVASNIWSAVFAVIVLHVALGLFIKKSYTEAEKGKPVSKID